MILNKMFHKSIPLLLGIALSFTIFSSCNTIQTGAQTPLKYRIIHNNDGTDALANMWFNRKPNLSRADINRYVDIVADSKVVTTFMMNTGSDFVYYRSKYERAFGDD